MDRDEMVSRLQDDLGAFAGEDDAERFFDLLQGLKLITTDSDGFALHEGEAYDKAYSDFCSSS